MPQHLIDYPLRVFLDLSTHHLSAEARSYVDLNATLGEQSYAKTPFGWFCWVPSEDGMEEDEPASLLACFAKAREMKAEYVLFDRDAAVSDILPVYDEADIVPRPRPDAVVLA